MDVIQALRTVMRGVDSRIRERVEWSASGFAGGRATVTCASLADVEAKRAVEAVLCQWIAFVQ